MSSRVLRSWALLAGLAAVVAGACTASPWDKAWAGLVCLAMAGLIIRLDRLRVFGRRRRLPNGMPLRAVSGR